MALNPKTSIVGRNAALDACFNLLNSGFIRIYDGTQPTDADTALGAQVLLATLAFGSTAFAAASAASKTANAITSGTAVATSTATWARLVKSDGTTVVHDMSVGLATSNLILNDVAITTGGVVAVTSLVISQAA